MICRTDREQSQRVNPYGAVGLLALPLQDVLTLLIHPSRHCSTRIIRSTEQATHVGQSVPHPQIHESSFIARLDPLLADPYL